MSEMTQLRAYCSYLDEIQGEIDLIDVVPPVQPIDGFAREHRERSKWLVAVAAAASVLFLVGGVAWLSPLGGLPPAAEPTTAVPTDTSVPTDSSVPPTEPTTTAIIEATEAVPPPGEGPKPASIVEQVVTSSSIGDAAWTVYEGDSTDILDALSNEAFADESDLALPDSLMAVDGIATDVSGETLGNAGEFTLTQWSVHVNWIETALLHGGDELAVRSDNGGLLVETAIESGIREISLYATDPHTGEHGEVEGEPIETIARYQWTSALGDSGWTFDVVDALTGEPVGSISSAFPMMTEDLILTVSQGETVESVRPDWFEVGREYETFYLNVDDSIHAYIKPGSINSPAAFEIWRSTDGTNWENLGQPQGFPSGYHPMHISRRDGLYLVNLDDITGRNEEGPDFLNIRSDDGINWFPVEDLPNTQGSIHRVETGWVWASPPGATATLSMWTSPDGTNWEPIDTTQIPGTFRGVNGGASGWTSSENALFASAYREDPPEERLWVVQFP